MIEVQPAPPPPPADSPQCSSPSSAGTLSDPAGRPKTPRRSHPGKINDVKKLRQTKNPPGSFHRVCSGKGQANVHARVARPAVLSNEGDNDSSKTEEWSFIHTASLLRAIEICLLLTQTPGLSTKSCQPSLLPVGPCCSFRPRQYSISS